ADGTYEEIGDEAAITDSGTQVVSLSTVEGLGSFDEGVVLYFRAVITDSAGNATTGTASTTTLTVDETPASVSAFSMDDVALQSGDTATVTLTFNEAVTGFNSDDDITEESGTLGTMTSDDDTAWTGTFTPSANTTDSSNTLTLATTYTDVAGNPGPTATTANYAVDTAANTVESFEMSDYALQSDETATVTLTFSEAVTGFNSDNDITAPNGTLSAMSSSNNGVTWTGTFTPDADTTEGNNVLTLAADSYTDAAGNNGPGATTANYAVDTDLPEMTTVSIASSTSNPTNAATRATTDQTVTLTIDADEDIAQPTVAFESGGANINGSVTYTDNNDSDASTWTASYTVNSGDTDGSVTFTLDFDDLAGNSGAQVTTVTDNSSVEVDQTAITLSSLTIASNNNNTSLAKADNTITLTIVAAENYSSAPTVTFTGANGNVTVAQGNDAATYTASYTVQSNDTNGPLAFEVTSTDAAGNESTNTALINDNTGVTIDTTVPVITLDGNSTVTHEAKANYTDAGASVTDNLDSSVSDNLDSTSNVNKDLIGSYTVVYSATDAAGNAAVDVTRTVNVVDTTIPVITRIGNEAVDHEAATAYTDEGATAADAYDGDITGSIVTVNPVDTDSALGDYTVTYNVVDANDNPAEQVTRTVTVVDTTAPVITRNGDAEVTVERLATYTDDGATASDSYYGNITANIVT
ncbi:Ig-like domain-containing protein, partial [Flavobacteriaceae bacterium]|nr:Ig-like domain-containing protein [Flavobacteriaceae bacterium]